MLDGALYTDARARRARLGARARRWIEKLPVGNHPTEGGARRGKPVPRPWGGGARRTELPSRASALGARAITVPNELTKEGLRGGRAPPNGPRLSCGADSRSAPRRLRLPQSSPGHKRNSSRDRAPSA